MKRLREMGVLDKPLEIGVTKNYYRARMRDPKEFQKDTIKTKDVGEKGGTLLVIGRPKGMKKTRTQSILIHR